MAHDVFISYSSLDKPAADAVCAVLESAGIRCWMAPRDILPGDKWGDAILRAIKSSKAMVLVFSGNANVSPQIEREVERAVNHGVIIVPLRIEDVMPTHSLEYFLSTPHWLDAFSPPLEHHLTRLARLLRPMIEETSKDKAAIGTLPPTGASPRQEKRPVSQILVPHLPEIFAWIRHHQILICGVPIALAAALILYFSLVGGWPSSLVGMPPETLRHKVAVVLDRQACSWLDVGEPTESEGRKKLSISGVSQTPGAIGGAVGQVTGNDVDLNLTEVYSLPQTACAAVDAFRRVRTSSDLPQKLTLEHPQYQLSRDAGACPLEGPWVMAKYSIADGPEDFEVIGVESSGEMQRLNINRDNLSDLIKSQPNYFSRAPDGSVELGICIDEASLNSGRGLQAIAVIIGHDLSEFEAISSTKPELLSDQWLSDFTAKAKAKGWRTEMAWFYIHQ